MQKLRALLFVSSFGVWTLGLGILALPALLHPTMAAKIAMFWVRGGLWLLKILCAIQHRIEGAEHIPTGSCIIAARHESAWETLALFAIVPNATFILKRELLRIPIYGWYLRAAGMIAINRKGGAGALKQMIKAVKSRIDKSPASIIIFPEGTRVPHGEVRELQPGLFGLYKIAQLPVHPVVHNSGLYWRKGLLEKHPGIIMLRFLPPVPADAGVEVLRQKLDRYFRDMPEEVTTTSDQVGAQP